MSFLQAASAHRQYQMPGLALNIRGEQHLHEHVAQLFLQVRRITGVDGLHRPRVSSRKLRRMLSLRLHLIPRAAIRERRNVMGATKSRRS